MSKYNSKGAINLSRLSTLLTQQGYDVEQQMGYGYIRVALTTNYEVEIYTDGRVMIDNNADEAVDAESEVTLMPSVLKQLLPVLQLVDQMVK